MRAIHWRVALGIVVVTMFASTAAYANHVFTDVDDGRFFTEAAEWAKEKGITTGCGDGTTFCPNDPVTRGENITFAKRYDDNIVQPALATMKGDTAAAQATADAAQADADAAQTAADAAQGDADSNAASIAAVTPYEALMTAPFDGDGDPFVVPGIGSFQITGCDATGVAATANWSSPDGESFDVAAVTVNTGIAVAANTTGPTLAFGNAGWVGHSTQAQILTDTGDVATALLTGLSPDGVCRLLIQVIP